MNAVIYARYSSYNQTERSIEGQIEDCMAYAARKGHTVIANYIDRAKSGTEAEHRTEFLRMIKDSAKKQFQTVIVWKQDRFSRNRYDFAVYKAQLKKNGVFVESANEPTSDDPQGILLDSLIEGMAEYYSKNLSQNVKRGMRVARSKGVFTGGRLPFGYTVNKEKHIIPDPEESAVLLDVFRRYAEGEHLTDIVNYMNEKGFKPRRGTKFTINSFEHVLSNRKYLGEYEIDGESYPDFYPRLMEESLFNAVQKRKEAARRAPAASKGDYEYLLQGKAFCGHCGAPMIGECGRGKQGVVYHYYTCAERKKNHTCKKRNERADELETMIIQQTIAYVTNPERLEQIAEGLQREYKKNFQTDEIPKLEALIKRFDRELDNCTEMLLSGKVSAALIDRMNQKAEEIQAKKDDAERDLSALKITARNSYTISDYKQLIIDMTTGEIDDISFRRRLISTFVNAVYIYDDKILLYYNVEEGQEQITKEEAESDIASAEKSADVSDSMRNPLPISRNSERLLFHSDLVFGFLHFRLQCEKERR